MPLRNPNISVGIEFPPSEVEERALDADTLMAACFFHPDDPRHLEFDDVRAVISEAEEMAAAARLRF